VTQLSPQTTRYRRRRRRRRRKKSYVHLDVLPIQLDGAEWLESVKLLGVFIDSKLFRAHFQHLLSVHNQSLHFLSQLRKRSLSDRLNVSP